MHENTLWPNLTKQLDHFMSEILHIHLDKFYLKAFLAGLRIDQPVGILLLYFTKITDEEQKKGEQRTMSL